MSYYNTANEIQPELSLYRAKAASQEAQIADYFRRQLFGFGFTPSEVWRDLMPEAPPTSVRRAMCDLTAIGVLVRTDERRLGPYKRPESVWRLA